MATLPTAIWISACAHQLHQHWRHADPVQLEETAWDLWRDDKLRDLGPVDAAKTWLAPLSSPSEPDRTYRA